MFVIVIALCTEFTSAWLLKSRLNANRTSDADINVVITKFFVTKQADSSRHPRDFVSAVYNLQSQCMIKQILPVAEATVHISRDSYLLVYLQFLIQ